MSKETMKKILKTLSQLDAYPKSTIEESVRKTLQGAAITIICFTIIGLLISLELIDYLTPNVKEELLVDTSRNPNIQINLDIVVPKISCDFLSLDAMDSSGEQHLQIDHNIYKRTLDLQGTPIEEPKREDITVPAKPDSKDSSNVECGSCYGAPHPKCCNTCEDVREAYRHQRWAFPDNPENITQCKNENFSEKMSMAFSRGCQIYGSLTVNRVSGSFHIAPGRSFTSSHIHVHDVQPFSSSSFNTTHFIRHLTFGSNIDSEAHNPLKDAQGIATEGATMFQYYIKIVPTMYMKQDRSIILSNQFSVTKHQKVISVISGESGMPGAFFQYELSPLMVKRTETSRSLGHFLTNACAIIGGVYTVAGLLDALLYNSVRLMKKIELGKQI